MAGALQFDLKNMSLKANLSIIVQLHQFQNISLPHKARYALEVHIFQGKSGKNSAIPFHILQTSNSFKKNVSKESFIDDLYFRSKKFNIEYQEQRIELNDCCEFRMSLQGFPQIDESDIYLEFILIENTACYFREDMDEPVDFKQAERYRFKLENISSGIIRYCEGEFSKSYISAFTFTLFAMITDYRFQLFANQNESDSARSKARQKIETIGGLMKWGEKYLKNCPNSSDYFYQRYVKHLLYNSVMLRIEVNNFLKNNQQQMQLKIPTGEGGKLVTVQDKEFFDYNFNYSPQTVTEDSLKNIIYYINQENFYFAQKVVDYISKGFFNMQSMRQKFRRERNDLFSARVVRSIVFGRDKQIKEQNIKMTTKLRQANKIVQSKILDEYLFVDKQNQHYAFLQVNLPYSYKTVQYENGSIENVLRELSEIRKTEFKKKMVYDEREMLVVFCHGFQASSFDMEMLKREVTKMLPLAHLHVSMSNEMNTETDIQVMGIRLADEIKGYVKMNFEDKKNVILNFVGHSMGGIIARAALPFLDQYHEQMGFFFSLSSPHLGYLNGVDTMIKTGLWVMRKMNDVLSLDQLAMQQEQKLKDTFLYKLSICGHLRNFNKIILLSSSDDSYVPWHSARICYYDGSNSRSKVERQMIESILGENIVHRIDIHFDIDSTKDIDTFIGRTAHINLLTQECFMKLINEAFPTLFNLTEL